MVWFHLMFILFSVTVWTAGAWHIKSRSPLYNIPMRGAARGFPMAAKHQLGNNSNRKLSIPILSWQMLALWPPIPLSYCHSKVAVELLDRRASFPSDGEIRGCRGPTGARRQIKQGGYPWSDTWSHFKGWERHWSPVISSERQSVRVKGGWKKELYQLRWYERGRTKHHLNVVVGWPLSIWRSEGIKTAFCWNAPSSALMFSSRKD